MSRPVDPNLIVRYAVLVSLTIWIPLPFVDRLVENLVRRHMVRAIAAQHGLELDDEAVRTLADRPGGGCMGCLWSVVLWPIKKLLKWVLTFLQFKEMADVGSETAHRAILLTDALAHGWLPQDPLAVREAMDRALEKVEIRPVERSWRGPFRGGDRDWRGLVGATTARDRERLAASARPEAPTALEASLLWKGLVPELVHAFRAEMGRAPELESRVAGAIEAAELLPPDEAAPEAAVALFPVEDAHEIERKDEGDES